MYCRTGFGQQCNCCPNPRRDRRSRLCGRASRPGAFPELIPHGQHILRRNVVLDVVDLREDQVGIRAELGQAPPHVADGVASAARHLVREAKTKKAMQHPWVFAGSRLEKHPQTGEKAYYADMTGELICVSNFPYAMLDLPIDSTGDDDYLLFEAFTERIPPRGTPVTLILAPVLRPKPKG